MSKYLVINDEQKILRLLFSGKNGESAEVDYAATIEEGAAMAGKNGHQFVIVQSSPAAWTRQGQSQEAFHRAIREKFPAESVLFVTNFKSIRSKEDAQAFGAGDFIISGALLKALATEKAEKTAAVRKDAMDKDRLKNSLIQVSNIFQSLLDLENPFQKGNIDSIVTCCGLVARHLSLAEDVVDTTEIAASLYDVGKIGMRRDLLLKKGNLDAEQKDLIEAHPDIACDLLKDVPFPWKVLPVIRAHHEKFDGSGYPEGMKGREIPIGARIIAVVDAFHAMIARRAYRKTLTFDEAIEELNKNAGVQFDPEVVEAFIQVAKKHFADKLQKSCLRILLVEEDLNTLATLKRVLELEGYEVIAMKRPAEAADIFKTFTPDLVVSDLFSEDGSGIGLLQTVKSTDLLEESLFVFLTADSTSEERVQALRMGADDIVTKPYELGEFILKLENLFRRTRKHRDAHAMRRKGGISGNLKEFSLPDLLQILGYGLKTALVTVRNGDREGKIYVEAGKAKHAAFESAEGKDALFELFTWPAGEFTLEHGVTINKTTIQDGSPRLLLELLERLDEGKRAAAPPS
jgi:response regulator RpfG family c-di-GMP phosphodiesterase